MEAAGVEPASGKTLQNLLLTAPALAPPAFELGGNRPEWLSDGGSSLADLPGTTGGTTTRIEDTREPFLPISRERPVVLHRDLDAVTEEVGFVLWQRTGSVESS